MTQTKPKSFRNAGNDRVQNAECRGERLPSPERLWLFHLACMALVVVLLAACGGGAKAPLTMPKLQLVVQPHRTANGGEVFYLVIKEVNEKSFAADTYEAIASLVSADRMESEVLGVFPLIPGQQQKIYTEKPSHNSLGLYFLFTNPEDGNWKRMMRQPLAGKYNVLIDKDKVTVKERLGAW